MATPKRRPSRRNLTSSSAPQSESTPDSWLSGPYLPLILAGLTFLLFAPSLFSDLVYDAHNEIIDEGFITNISNLPQVFSPHIFESSLILAYRPGQLLYLMIIALFSGKSPIGYHLCSNLLHALNIALFFILLRRLIQVDHKNPAGNTTVSFREKWIALIATTLLLAFHPLATESVAEVSYSSVLLVTFFTLCGLLAATSFRPEMTKKSWIYAGVGTFCCFASLACKESGLLTLAMLIIYWFLYRRKEARNPWALFLGLAILVSGFYLSLRFHYASPYVPHLAYLGNTFTNTLWIETQLQVYMLGKILWPLSLSADYALPDLSLPSFPVALTLLILVIAGQVWLCMKSRIGALGVALYWVGLASVSNLIPLFHFLADRYYYQALGAVGLQFLGLLFLIPSLQIRRILLGTLLISLLPFAWLSWQRQAVFASEESLWVNTLAVCPSSGVALNAYGDILIDKGQIEAGMANHRKCIQINPQYPTAYNNLGTALLNQGKIDEAIPQFNEALQLNPYFGEAYNNKGLALLKKGDIESAMLNFQKTLQMYPTNADAHLRLGLALGMKGQADDALLEFEKILIDHPDNAFAHNYIAVILMQKGRLEEAQTEFLKALQLKPDFTEAKNNLAHLQKVAGSNPSLH